MIDAAIVGLGRWGRTLVESVQGKSDRLRFTRAVVRSPEPHRGFAEASGLALTDDFAEVLADPSVTAVVLATPHSLHCEQIIAAASAGKHVFCEKPLTLTKAEAVRAIEACEAAGIVLGVGTDKRFYPALRELVRLVKGGDLGEVDPPRSAFQQRGRRRVFAVAVFGRGIAGRRFDRNRDSHARRDDRDGRTGPACAGPAVVAQAAARPARQPIGAARIRTSGSVVRWLRCARHRYSPGYTPLPVMHRPKCWAGPSLVLRKSGVETEHLTFAPVDTVRVNLEAFADAVTRTAPYPITTSQVLATVSAFEAIAKAVKTDQGVDV